MSKVNWWKRASIGFLIFATAAIILPAQTAPATATAAPTFTLLHSFNYADGLGPEELVQGTDGNLYGTTGGGGANNSCDFGCGTVFTITPGGTLTTLHSFDYTDGDQPVALILAIDGNFYGVTNYGGANICIGGGCGTVFRVTPGGTLTTLHSFDGPDGFYPSAGLVQATDGNFYGMTVQGGANSCVASGCGTVFTITPGGQLTTLHIFDSTDGLYPYGGLVQGTDGNLYGTTSGGGADESGTVFRIAPGGTLTTLYSFCSQTDCPDGTNPPAGLVQGTDGNFYGTTAYGGIKNSSCSAGCGTVFRITPGGVLTTLHRFGGADGNFPLAALILATDGNFYGTTSQGDPNDGGTVFRITPAGMLTTLHSFVYYGMEGAFPSARLVQDTNGKFYGTTPDGGIDGDGTVFSLSVGLGPFVETLPAFGKVGTPVHILGTNLTGTTNVTFNGTPATFTVVSKTLILTNVPAGATTGKVQVVTTNVTLSSNVPFQVLP